MAESTLSLGYSDLQTEVGYYLGYGRTVSNYTTTQSNLVIQCIKRGLRRFYNPSLLPNENKVHQWSFMHPVTTITVGPLSRTASGLPTYDAGTGYSTITLTADGFDTRSDSFTTTVTFGTSGTAYTIVSVTSTTVALVSGDASGETTDDSVTISGQQDYDLPDNFGDIEGVLTFSSSSQGYISIPTSSESELRRRRQFTTSSGRPVVAAVRPKSFDGSNGQRYELMLWPPPDSSYTLTYKYLAIPNALSDTYPYPMGGEIHAETILLSCLAAAEEYIEDDLGVKKSEYLDRLRTSIETDRQMITPETLGYNGDNSDTYYESDSRFKRHRTLNDGISYTTVEGSIP